MTNILKENQVLKLNKYAKEYIDNNNDLNYQKITEQMREFSNADYVMLNIFDDDGKEFTIVGFSGKRDKIKKVVDVIGFNLIGKKLKYLKGTHEKFEKSIVTRIKKLKDMVGSAFSERTIFLIEKIFDIKDILVLRIVKDDKNIGNFTLIFSKSESESNYKMLELFASQVGLFISKKENDKKIKDSKERLENILEANNIGTWEHNFETDKEVINEKWAEMLGYSLEKISSHSNQIWKKSIHPDDKKRVEKEFEKLKNKEIEYYELDVRMKHKRGRYLWINDRAKIIKWTEEGKPLLASGTHIDITEKKNIEIELLNNRNKLRNILETTQDGFWVVDKNHRIIDVNDAYCKMSGYKREELLNLKIPDLEFYENEKEADERIKKILKKGHDIFETKHIKKNGEVFDVEASASCLSKEPVEIVSFCRDITEKKKINLKTIEMKERLENIIEGTNVGTWERNIETNEGIINKKWAEMLGYSSEEIKTVNHESFEKLTNPDDLEKAEREFERLINKEIEYYDVEIKMKHKNGKWIWINSRGKVTKWSSDSKPIIVSGTHTDITEKKEKQEKIEYLSFHDHLTGLYNRRYMEDSIERLDTNRNIPFSIIVADINGLKLTNDAYGHRMGDKLLIATAEILKKSCRKEDIICRVGGDEFVILLPDTDKEISKEIIRRIKEESESYKLDSVIISIAIGFSTKNNKDENIFKIYKDADNQMYENKLKIGRIMRSKTIETLLININNKYDNEQIHTERTSQYCESISKAMKLSEKQIQDAKIAGVLHDVGKIVVDPDILNKNERLTDKELEEIKRHPTISYQLLKNVDEYSHLAKAVLYHHERIDGTGYPEGLLEDEIPLLSKIISVADAYEAMTANRPYKITKTKEEAIEELRKYSGIQFDEEIIDVFVNEVL